MRITLRPSRQQLTLVSGLHLMAALAIFHSALAAWLPWLLVPLLSSLLWHCAASQLKLPACIVALELKDDCCIPIFRGRPRQAWLAARIYCAPRFQVLYFSCSKRLWTLPLLIWPDSCSEQEQRQLRRFLRWRVLC